jgi:hypothetical protein
VALFFVNIYNKQLRAKREKLNKMNIGESPANKCHHRDPSNQLKVVGVIAFPSLKDKNDKTNKTPITCKSLKNTDLNTHSSPCAFVRLFLPQAVINHPRERICRRRRSRVLNLAIHFPNFSV